MTTREELKDSQLYAVDYLYGVGTEDVDLECRSLRWVRTRYSHECLSILHEGERTVPAGSRMIAERAKVEGKFGTCYTCENCVRAAQKELNR